MSHLKVTISQIAWPIKCNPVKLHNFNFFLLGENWKWFQKNESQLCHIFGKATTNYYVIFYLPFYLSPSRFIVAFILFQLLVFLSALFNFFSQAIWYKILGTNILLSNKNLFRLHPRLFLMPLLVWRKLQFCFQN